VKQSGIGWCDFSGGNLNVVVRGSTPGDCECGPGCANCYVKAIDDRFHFLPEHTTYYWDKLERLVQKRFPEFSPKRGAPHKPMCFIADTGDLFHENVSDMFIFSALARFEWVRQDVIWQILTKRPKRMRELIQRRCRKPRSLPDNIWLGVSVETQDYTWRIDELMKIDAAVRWVSLEPMLSAIDIENYLPLESYVSCMETPNGSGVLFREGLDWVVLGAESGPNRRPFKVEWAVDIKTQCDATGVAFFGKQDSGLYPGKPLIIDGKEWKDWPDD